MKFFKNAIIAAFCLIVVPSYAYVITFDNANAVGRIALTIIIYSNAQEWLSMDAGKKITETVFNAVKEAGGALSSAGGSKNSTAAGEVADVAVKAATKATAAVATGGISEAVGLATQVLAEPLKVMVDEIVKSAKEKRKHYLTAGSGRTTDTWSWKDIAPWGNDSDRTVFGVVFDETDQTYLGTFVVDVRGEVRLKIDPKNKSLYLQIWNYDESVPNTNLRKVFETVGWDTVGQPKITSKP